MEAKRNRVERVDISLVQRNSFNIVDYSPLDLYREQQRIKVYGQLFPVVCRQIDGEQYQSIHGDLTLEALKTLGEKTAEVKDLGNISDIDAKLLHINFCLSSVTIDEAELAFVIGALSQEIDVNYLKNTINLKKEEINHYLDIYNFSFEFYKQETNQIGLF